MLSQHVISRITNDTHDHDQWRPTLYKLNQADQRQEFESLITESPHLSIADTIEQQLAEIVCARSPAQKLSDAVVAKRIDEHLSGCPMAEYGTWVYYPWRQCVVHVLPQHEYEELRSERNRYKITPQEQATLKEFTIGFVGLSVGHAIAVTMALEGIGGRFRLADMDMMSLSNMNRVPCDVMQLGINKTVVAARRVYEINPYLEVTIFPNGLQRDNQADFLGESEQKIDLLIEECDDLYTKINVRERAKDLRIPVIMETNDRGLLDVERFDREPDRPILHGLLGDIRSEHLKGLTTKEKVPFILAVLGQEAMSARLAASLVEIDETVTGWSQLGSGTILGGAVVTDTARRLLLGEFNESGRYYVDLHEIVADGIGDETCHGSSARSRLSDEEQPGADCHTSAEHDQSIVRNQERSVVVQKAFDQVLNREEAFFLLERAILAPSGGNAQPWQFEYLPNGRLIVSMCMARVSSPLLDFRYTASCAAIGASVENILLSAAAIGVDADVQLHEGEIPGSLFAELAFKKNKASRIDPLEKEIEKRVTNRNASDGSPLSQDEIAALQDEAARAGGKLTLLTDEREIYRAADFLAKMDRFRLFCRKLHDEMMSELRWTAKEAETTKTGIDIATLELSPTDQAGLRMMKRWASVKFLRHIGGGAAVEDMTRRMIQSSSGVGLLRCSGTGATGFFSGGRVMQRIWLRATALGLSFQPWSISPYLFARLRHGKGEGFSEAEQKLLLGLLEHYTKLFGPSSNDKVEPLLFRLARAEGPSVRSMRLPVDAVSSFP